MCNRDSSDRGTSTNLEHQLSTHMHDMYKALRVPLIVPQHAHILLVHMAAMSDHCAAHVHHDQIACCLN